MATNYREQESEYANIPNHNANRDAPTHNTALKLQSDVSGQIAMTKFFCANCKNEEVSEIRCEPNKWTCLYASLLTPICLCFIPFSINTCQDVYHKCPCCKTTVGFTEYAVCD